MSDQQQPQDEKAAHSQLQLENKTEHVLHITLAGGEVVTVPPTEHGAHVVKFADAEERARFEQALNTETVQQWLRDQQLVVHGGSAPQQSTGSTPNAGQPGPQVQTGTGAQSHDPASSPTGTGAQSHDPASSPTSPASKRGRGAQE